MTARCCTRQPDVVGDSQTSAALLLEPRQPVTLTVWIVILGQFTKWGRLTMPVSSVYSNIGFKEKTMKSFTTVICHNYQLHRAEKK